MQTAVGKAVRIGRATALAVGVGVVLALVMGVATVALAAVPGDPFRLGQVNGHRGGRGGATDGDHHGPLPARGLRGPGEGVRDPLLIQRSLKEER